MTKSIKFEKIIPREILDKIEKFKKENCIKHISKNNNDFICCDNCLKAHAIKSAQELHYTLQLQKYIETNLPGQIGHAGYYLNNNVMVKLQ